VSAKRAELALALLRDEVEALDTLRDSIQSRGYSFESAAFAYGYLKANVERLRERIAFLETLE